MVATTCENCGAQRGPDDVFCESCGMDFISGSMPDLTSDTETATVEGPSTSANGAEPLDPSSGPVAEATSSNSTGIKLYISTEVDREQFNKVVQEGELAFPDPPPAAQKLELAGSEFHIGRTSASRAIYPDLDILQLTKDEAVSSRHALIRIDDNGKMQLVDVGSTNGTTVASVDAEPLKQGEPIDLEPGSTIYLGAWTKLTILEPPVA